MGTHLDHIILEKLKLKIGASSIIMKILLRISESEVNSGSLDNSVDIEGSNNSFNSSDDKWFFPTY